MRSFRSMRGRVLHFALSLLLTTIATRHLLAQQQAEEPQFTRETAPAPEIAPSDQVCTAFELKLDSSVGRSCQSLAQLAIVGRWREARPLAEKLALEVPSNGIGPYWLGLTELQAGNTLSAFRQLDAALSLSPSVFWVHLNLGLCYALLRQYTLFEQEMQWVIHKHPSQPLPYYYLGRHYSKTKEETDKGLAMLQRAVSLNPADFRARYHLGYLFELKDRHEEAKAAYQQASEGAAAHRSSYSWPLQGLARLYLQEANLAEALRYARMAVGLDPKLSENELLLARIYLQRGESGLATTSLERAAVLDPTDPAPHYLLSRAYAQTKRPKEAEQSLATYTEVKAAYGN
jgi:predicted Zn-dependent protease